MFLEGIEVEHWLEISGSNKPQKLGFSLIILSSFLVLYPL